MGILVYRDKQLSRDLVGRIDYNAASGEISFEYDTAYLACAQALGELGISEMLSLNEAPYTASEFAPFFRGLLPEGKVYSTLADFYQVPRSDYLSILEEIGCESIGALMVVPEQIVPSECEPRYEPIGKKTVDAMLTNPTRMAAFTASSTRLSLAGAQSKVAWLLPEGKDAGTAKFDEWLVPYGTAPSTHIVKISRRGEESIAANEAACSILSEACGIRTAKVSEIPGLPGVIAVERYDREWVRVNGRSAVARLHQEDFCQALGLAPHFKYQPQGLEVSYPAMMAELIESASANPRDDKLQLAKRIAFCYVVGNSDMHLKNFSLLYNHEWTERHLSPLYDVMCIPLTDYSTDMPFDVGDHRRIDDIDARDFTLLAIELDIGMADFADAVRSIVNVLEAPSLKRLNQGTERMVDRIMETSKERIKVLRRFLG